MRRYRYLSVSLHLEWTHTAVCLPAIVVLHVLYSNSVLFYIARCILWLLCNHMWDVVDSTQVLMLLLDVHYSKTMDLPYYAQVSHGKIERMPFFV